MDEPTEMLQTEDEAQSSNAQEDPVFAGLDDVDLKPRTMIIFHTDAYLRIFPYCKAILESDKVQADSDEEFFHERLGIYVPAVIIAGLDAIACTPGKAHMRQSAAASLQMINKAVLDKNPYLEKQNCASVAELRHPIGTTLENDSIYERVQLLTAFGASVITVTDDKFLQSKFSLMSLKWLNLADFISRYHWLTPSVTAQIVDTMQAIGQEATFQFAELVATTVVWKGAIALLSPLTMPTRMAMLPLKALEDVLRDIAVCRQRLKKFLKQAPVFNETFDADQVEKTRKAWTTFHQTPRGIERVKQFVSSMEDTVRLCTPVSLLFINMRTRVQLLVAFCSVLSNIVFLTTLEHSDASTDPSAIFHGTPSPPEKAGRFTPTRAL